MTPTEDAKERLKGDLHYRYQIETAVNIGFWWDAPVERRTRQTLEQAMIQKWRSPFNKAYRSVSPRCSNLLNSLTTASIWVESVRCLS